jgi:muconolactone delta-isomerase
LKQKPARGVMHKYMVTITLPIAFTEEYMKLIPRQRAMIVELLSTGKLSSFSLNRDRSIAWLVALCPDEEALQIMLGNFPMHKYFEYEINELILHDTQFMGLPKVVLN